MIPVIIEREMFDTLSDERLGYACMEPTFQQIRAQSPEVKKSIIAQLGEGQRALCMFRILYDHSHKSAEEYYGWICYLLDQPGYWRGILEGAEFFGDTRLSRLLEESRTLFEARNDRLGKGWGDAAITDLGRDNELGEAVSRLYMQFQEITGFSLQNIAGYIRAHPQAFVEFREG